MSFQKASSSRLPYVPGTRPSARNNQLVTSCGLPELDALLGGGLPVGSILLVQEDVPSVYSSYVERYFLAEGAIHTHGLFYGKLAPDADSIFENLPAFVANTDDPISQKTSESTDKMKIAWRYETLPKVDSTVGGRQTSCFDLAAKMPQDVLDKCEKSVFSEPGSYSGLCSSIHRLVHQPKYASSDSEYMQERWKETDGDKNVPKSLLRLVLSDYGSPLWSDGADFCRTLALIQQWIRDKLAVLLLTLPQNLVSPESLEELQESCDAVIKLESFSGTEKEKNPVFSDFHGQLHIIKLPTLNTLLPQIPDSLDLGFKLKRKRFAIETMHLPPEFGEQTAEGCGSGFGSKLDF